MRVADANAAGGLALLNPNHGTARIVPARSAPTNYFEIAFTAEANVPYRIWLRMGASGNLSSNDSVHLQFSDSVDASGTPIARIGTTASLEPVLQAGLDGPAPVGWGWADTGWETPGPPISFETSGVHVVRVQQREDGAAVDQIVLSPDTYLTNAPGPRQDDVTILQWTDGASPPSAEDTVVLWTADGNPTDIFGNWHTTADSGAAGGAALRNPNAGLTKIAPALAAPVTYFEMTFPAKAGLPYHVWIRMKADANSKSNDSVHVQFEDAFDGSGTPYARIGATASAEFVLQAGPEGSTPQDWGWTENGWSTYGPHVYFATTGTHRLRVQQREDGPTIDQIVVSGDAFLTIAPGARRNDTTILPRTTAQPGNQPPTVALSAPAAGATFPAPAAIQLEATASDSDGGIQRVDFYSGSTLLASSSAAPYSYTWTAVPAGTYTLTARAIDAAGAEAASAPVTVSVGAPNEPPTVSLTAPANGATFTAPATITLSANASDPEDQVTRVDFYSGATLLGSDSAAPHSFVWTSVPAGTYTLTARATDAVGNQTQSATATITVSNPLPPPQTFTVAFTASIDHDSSVASYTLEVFDSGADPSSATPLTTSDLAKPTPDSNREIRVDRTSFLSALAPGTYVVTVSAIGPGGVGRSAPYSFVR